jgi:hypothetical protein
MKRLDLAFDMTKVRYLKKGYFIKYLVLIKKLSISQKEIVDVSGFDTNEIRRLVLQGYRYAVLLKGY